MTNGQQTLG
ncbi:unnamed protein product, partial [Allacma fusca]